MENLKKFDVTKCPLHANQECILKRVYELKSSRKLFSMKSETDDGLSSCSHFPERSTEKELVANKPVLPEIEHLKGKISDKELDSLRAVLNRNAEIFSKLKADIGCCNFVEHEIEIEEGSVPHITLRGQTNDPSQVGSVQEGNRDVNVVRHDRAIEVPVGLWRGHGQKERGTTQVLL